MGSESSEGKKQARALRPRETSSVAMLPATITNRTCAAMAGVDERPFAEIVTRHGIPHARLGRLLIVRTDDWLAAIARLGASREPGEAPLAEVEREAETTADVLAALGLRRAS